MNKVLLWPTQSTSFGKSEALEIFTAYCRLISEIPDAFNISKNVYVSLHTKYNCISSEGHGFRIVIETGDADPKTSVYEYFKDR